MNFKYLSLIDTDQSIVNIDFKKQNIFLNDIIDLETMKTSFSSDQKFEFVIDYYQDFYEKIQALKDASSISEYNNLIYELRQSNPERFSFLEEKDFDIDESVFLISKTRIFDNFLISLKDVYKPFLDFIEINKNEIRKFDKAIVYLGYGLISGNINEKSKLNTYLFNKLVEIKYDDLKITFTVKKDLFVNKNAVLYLLDNLQTENNNLVFKSKFKTIDEIRNYISDLLCYNVPIIEEVDLSIFSYSTNAISTIKIYDVFGVVTYDLSDSLVLRQASVLKPENVKILNKTLKHDNDHYKNIELTANPLIQVNTPLNLFQKYAMRSALFENTLIYGPPGTGKSETITNIVVNLLVNGKTVLMTSQQQAAIDVIFKRLNNLRDFVLYLDNYDDTELFYKQIQNMSWIVGECLLSKTLQFNASSVAFNDYDRAIDYNVSNQSFIDDINEYLAFCRARDENNTDYKKYLVARKNIDEFISVHLDKIKAFYKDYELQYVKLQNEIDFISKVSEFNIFVNDYNLNDLLLNKLYADKKEFIDFLILENIVDLIKINFDDVSEKIKKLNKFLKDNLLLSDNEFNSKIETNKSFLISNFKKMEQIKRTLSFLQPPVIKMIIGWLVKKAKSHEKFLNELKKANKNQRLYAITNYFRRNRISIKKSLFVSYKEHKPDIVRKHLAILECVEIFNSMNLLKQNTYLNTILEQDKSIFDPVVLYFFTNEDKMTKQFFELYSKQIVRFSQPVINRFYQSKLNQIDHYFKIVNTYKFDVLTKYFVISSLNMDSRINQYLKDNNDYVNRLNQTIYQFFKHQVRQRVLKQNEDFKRKMLQMFKLSNNDIQFPKIKNFILEYYEQLKVLYSAWLIRPEFICALTPFKENVFDTVVFDEASQVVLEKSYPILFRVSQAIITGDNKQLQPNISKYVLNKIKFWINNTDNINFDNALSLLDRVRTAYWNTYYLKNHYRSLDYRLIDYSNLNFYNNELIYLTKNKNEIPPFDIIKMKDGVCINNTNLAEAEKIIELTREVLDDVEKNQEFSKILIIAFTTEQAELIKELVEKDPIKNQSIIRLIKSKQLTINDLCSLQGEEGDLCLISLVFDKHSMDLGILSTYQANNFLNVAITRAKKQNIFLKSLDYKDVKDVWDKNNATFANYVNYLDKIQEQLYLRTQNLDIHVEMNDSSSFKKEVYEYLQKYFADNNLDYKCVRDLKIGSFKIDIAVYKDDIKDIKLALMLNDYKKHLTLDEFLLDLDLYSLFISRGYRPVWVLYTQWVTDKDYVMYQINSVLEIQKKENEL